MLYAFRRALLVGAGSLTGPYVLVLQCSAHHKSRPDIC